MEQESLDFNNKADAHTYVMNSGVLEYDWGQKNGLEVLNELSEYLYRKGSDFKSFNEVVKAFYSEVLGKDTSDLNL